MYDICTSCRHLKDLLRDTNRSDYLFKEHNQILADFSRQRMTKDTVSLLLKLAEKAQLKQKIDAMFKGEHINVTEDRPVLHVALRAPREQASSAALQISVPSSCMVCRQMASKHAKNKWAMWHLHLLEEGLVGAHFRTMV